MKVVWTERAWERLTEIEAFVARDHPEAAVRLVDKLIARGDAQEAACPLVSPKNPLPAGECREL